MEEPTTPTTILLGKELEASRAQVRDLKVRISTLQAELSERDTELKELQQKESEELANLKSLVGKSLGGKTQQALDLNENAARLAETISEKERRINELTENLVESQMERNAISLQIDELSLRLQASERTEVLVSEENHKLKAEHEKLIQEMQQTRDAAAQDVEFIKKAASDTKNTDIEAARYEQAMQLREVWHGIQKLEHALSPTDDADSLANTIKSGEWGWDESEATEISIGLEGDRLDRGIPSTVWITARDGSGQGADLPQYAQIVAKSGSDEKPNRLVLVGYGGLHLDGIRRVSPNTWSVRCTASEGRGQDRVGIRLLTSSGALMAARTLPVVGGTSPTGSPVELGEAMELEPEIKQPQSEKEAGVLNLAHCDLHFSPDPVGPGGVVKATLSLRDDEGALLQAAPEGLQCAVRGGSGVTAGSLTAPKAQHGSVCFSFNASQDHGTARVAAVVSVEGGVSVSLEGSVAVRKIPMSSAVCEFPLKLRSIRGIIKSIMRSLRQNEQRLLAYTTAMDDQESEKDDLQEINKKLEQDLEESNEKLNKIADENTKLAGELLAASGRLTSAQDATARATESEETYKTALAECSQKLIKASEESQELLKVSENDIKVLETTNNNLLDENTKLNQMLKEKVKQLVPLQAALEHERAEARAAQQLANSFSKEKEVALSQLRDTKAKSQQLEDDVITVKDLSTAAELKLEEVMRQNKKTLEDVKGQCDRKVADLKDVLENKELDIKDLKAFWEASKHDVASLNNKLLVIAQEKVNIEGSLEAVTKNLAASRAEASEWAKRTRNLEAELGSANATINQLEEDLEAAVEEANKVAEEWSSHEAAAAKICDEKAVLAADVEYLQGELAEKTNEIQYLTEQESIRFADINAKDALLLQQANANEKLATSNAALGSQSVDMEKEVERLQEMLADAKEAERDAREQLNFVTEECNAKTALVEDLKADTQRQEVQRKSVDLRRSEMQRDCDSLRTDNQELQEEGERLRCAMAVIEAQCKQYKAQLKSIKKETENKEAVNVKGQQEHEALMTSAAQDIEALQWRIQQLEAELVEVKQTRDMLQEHLSELNQQLNLFANAVDYAKGALEGQKGSLRRLGRAMEEDDAAGTVYTPPSHLLLFAEHSQCTRIINLEQDLSWCTLTHQHQEATNLITRSCQQFEVLEAETAAADKESELSELQRVLDGYKERLTSEQQYHQDTKNAKQALQEEMEGLMEKLSEVTGMRHADEAVVKDAQDKVGALEARVQNVKQECAKETKEAERRVREMEKDVMKMEGKTGFERARCAELEGTVRGLEDEVFRLRQVANEEAKMRGEAQNLLDEMRCSVAVARASDIDIETLLRAEEEIFRLKQTIDAIKKERELDSKQYARLLSQLEGEREQRGQAEKRMRHAKEMVRDWESQVNTTHTTEMTGVKNEVSHLINLRSETEHQLLVEKRRSESLQLELQIHKHRAQTSESALKEANRTIDDLRSKQPRYRQPTRSHSIRTHHTAPSLPSTPTAAVYIK
eukprot:TRINITY_DN2415_c0_g2_i2.p1 TRINITY_DN2415_c0_g2~~TRINITY_DN2415_c0_g2_i2.p1  ORF type:complete len:1509 (+),score=478.70 TRINITY_DN2415_c0_g2_i2:69-4595(+)